MDEKKKLIMIVEDDVFVRDIYETKIVKEGYDCVSATNGVEALKKLEEEGVMPDLILLDIVMPYMDGLTVLKKIRAQEKFAKIPVILLTNLGDSNDVEKSAELGAQSYMIKSHFTPSEVMEKLRDFIA